MLGFGVKVKVRVKVRVRETRILNGNEFYVPTRIEEHNIVCLYVCVCVNS